MFIVLAFDYSNPISAGQRPEFEHINDFEGR